MVSVSDVNGVSQVSQNCQWFASAKVVVSKHEFAESVKTLC
jgi:hypothetical protein